MLPSGVRRVGSTKLDQAVVRNIKNPALRHADGVKGQAASGSNKRQEF